jgi:exodeoxyribonuclease V gamma subunit
VVHPVLHVHRAERADALISALRDLLADPLPDPFAAEVVSVPTRGVERWLTQRLSTGLGASGPDRLDGICANVDFPGPRRLLGDAVAAASGIDPDKDPWLPERSVWTLLEVVDASLAEPWLETLREHLSVDDDARRARRFSAVRHVADLFNRYALLRPELVRAWARGEDAPAGSLGAGAEAGPVAIPPEAAWQAELWRRLRARIDVPDPAERLEAACARLRVEPGVVDLPARLSVFGLTRLPAAHLQVLDALAAHRDVHLFLLHPSPALWGRIAPLGPVVRRADDPTATLPRNRLLASWGNDARELQLVLAQAGARADHHHAIAADDTASLLQRIQAGVRDDAIPVGPPLRRMADERPRLAPGDRSIEIHACHGRARQVEVVRDAILHLLDEDPTLELRDVIVMCPDIEAFAPLIQATFGAGEAVDEDEVQDGARPPGLRVRLADRSLRQTNPVLNVVSTLIELAEQRLTASQVLDLADRDPVRRRFRFDDDDVARIQDWVAASGIRWGLDAPHRKPYKLDTLAAGTWQAGLDRVLVGVTMTEDDQRLFGGVLPLDDVESGVIDLAGRFAELVDRLQAACDRLSGSKPVAGWAEAIAEAADALTDTPPLETWQRAELDRILDAVVDEAGAAADTRLSLPEIRALLADRLQGRPTRANFRTGHLTICTLVPMRSVPHRVVCLLGLDDAVFPRKSPRDGDDLVLEDPHVGDRDSRAEDRQQLLDALMAATDRLVITYTGNDERTNVERPPAVPVGELLDVIDRTAVAHDGTSLRRAVVVQHPLQPFDPRNFLAGALRGDAPWSFDRVTLDGARALDAPRVTAESFLPEPLQADPGPVLELDALVRFVERPARAFLRQRLGISVTDYHDEVADALPIELDGLETWQVADRLLAARMAGTRLDRAIDAEVARGSLPPGELAGPVIRKVRSTVEDLAATAEQLVGGRAEPGSVDVKLVLDGGRSLSGTVPGVCAGTLLNVTYSRVSPRHRLAAWVRWLALTAAHPDRGYESVVVGRARYGVQRADITTVRLGAPDGDAAAYAREQLAVVVDLYERGMREPLPLYCLTSAAYAEAARAGGDARDAAAKAWESGWNRPGEDREPEHELILGGVLAYDEIDVPGPAPSAFSRCAEELWAGVLAAEETAHR